MRIAVSYNEGNVFEDFIHTAHFKIYDIKEGRIEVSLVIKADCCGYGALVALLKEMKAEVLVCGQIASGTRLAVAQAGITLYANIEGDADAAVESLLAGLLRHDTKSAIGC